MAVLTHTYTKTFNVLTPWAETLPWDCRRPGHGHSPTGATSRWSYARSAMRSPNSAVTNGTVSGGCAGGMSDRTAGRSACPRPDSNRKLAGYPMEATVSRQRS